MIPRQALERTGGFCEEFDGAGFEDLWTLLLLRELGEFAYVPESLTLYRVGHSGALADKYAPAYPVFIALVKQRYGRKGKAVDSQREKYSMSIDAFQGGLSDEQW